MRIKPDVGAMAWPDPKRLAAVDMYGRHGSLRRRRIIRAEFVAGVVGCISLGILAVFQGSAGWIVLGVWLLGAGANYLPLALEAQRLSRPGALDAEIAGLEIGSELRAAARASLWIAMPFAILLAAWAIRRERPSQAATDGALSTPSRAGNGGVHIDPSRSSKRQTHNAPKEPT